MSSFSRETTHVAGGAAPLPSPALAGKTTINGENHLFHKTSRRRIGAPPSLALTEKSSPQRRKSLFSQADRRLRGAVACHDRQTARRG